MIPIVQISDIPKKNLQNIQYSNLVDNKKIIRWYFSTVQNLLYLFDKSNVNKDYPFVYCKVGSDKEYTKCLTDNIQYELVDDVKKFDIKNSELEEYIITYYRYKNDTQRIIITPQYIEFQQSIKLIGIELKTILLNFIQELEEFIDEDQLIKTKGVFYIWNLQNYNKNLFLDFITNNELARKFLIVKEVLSLQKERKTNINISYTYPSKYGNLPLSLSIVTHALESGKGQKIFRSIPVEQWQSIGFGKTYLSVNLSIKNLDTFELTSELTNDIIVTFAKLIGLYVEDAENIQNEYKKFTSDDIKFIVDKKVTKKVTLSSQFPSIFVTGYSRKCQVKQNGHPRQPKVFSTLEELRESIPNEDVSYMAFPADDQYIEYVKEKLDDDDVNPLPIDHPPIYVACDNEYHSNVGLQVNLDLSNKDTIPYLPCCFAKDQYRKGEHLWNYLHDIDPNDVTKLTASTDIVKRNIQLKPNVKGLINVDLSDTLKIIKPNYKFYRMGVKSSKNESFIGCLSTALNIDINIEDIIENGILLTSIKQCNYDMTFEEIIGMLQNNAVYLDPRRLLPLFEFILKINIILIGEEWNSNTEQYETTIVQPRNKQHYLKWKNNYEYTILVYLSTGSSHKSSEQCELIIAQHNEKQMTVFKRDMYEYFEYLTSKIYNQFSLFTPYYLFDLPDFISRIKYQSIDSYGKVYRIQVDDFTLDTQPLPPFPEIKIKKLKIHIIQSKDQLLSLIKDTDYYIRDNKIIFNRGNINYVVYWKENTQIVDLDNYVNEQRCANILKDIFIYLFSKYLYNIQKNLSEKQLKKFDINSVNIKEFTDSLTIANNDEEFESGTQFLLQHPPTFLRSKEYSKLFIIPNAECKNRLVYYLQLLLKYNPTYVVNYKDNIYLDHYYNTIYDFTKNPDYFITSSLDTINVLRNQYNVSETILPNISTPYFILSEWTSFEHPVLTYNLYSVENALKLSTFWKRHHYIPEVDYDGTFIYPEEFENDYMKSNEEEYTLLDFNNPTKSINSDGNNEYIRSNIIVKFTNDDTKLYCPLLY